MAALQTPLVTQSLAFMVFVALYGFLIGGYPPLVGQINFGRIESSTDIELQAAILVPHITFR